LDLREDVSIFVERRLCAFAAIGWRPARVFPHLESKHRQAQHALTERTFFVVRYVKAVS
jgi:hypothetical protein